MRRNIASRELYLPYRTDCGKMSVSELEQAEPVPSERRMPNTG